VLKLYHGTNHRFSEFIPSISGAQGPGIYMTDVVGGYGSISMQLHVLMRNPFFFHPSEESLEAEVNPELIELVLGSEAASRVFDRIERDGYEAYGFEVQDELKARGHDGIVMVYPFGEPKLAGVEGSVVVIAFDPAQIFLLPEADLAISAHQSTPPGPFPEAGYSVWPERLTDDRDIAAYVAEMSPYEVDEEQIEELYRGSHAKLKWIELDILILQSENHHEISKSRQRKCDDSPVETMPPLLVEGRALQDGYHRLRTLREKGVSWHWAYVIEPSPDSVLEAQEPRASRFDRFYGDYKP
jgi:hypothetical protein